MQPSGDHDTEDDDDDDTEDDDLINNEEGTKGHTYPGPAA